MNNLSPFMGQVCLLYSNRFSNLPGENKSWEDENQWQRPECMSQPTIPDDPSILHIQTNENGKIPTKLLRSKEFVSDHRSCEKQSWLEHMDSCKEGHWLIDKLGNVWTLNRMEQNLENNLWIKDLNLFVEH